MKSFRFFCLFFTALPVALPLTGCTSIEAVPLDKDIRITEVKIIENPENRVADFEQVCKNQFARWGISTRLYPYDEKISPEDYVMTYTTEREWDIKMFLFKAHIELSHQGKMIASGDYHAIGGMFSLASTKLNPTSWKMRRVFEKMMRFHQLSDIKSSAGLSAVDEILNSEELTDEEKVKVLKVLKK